MHPLVKERQRSLPVGVHSKTRAVVTLQEVEDALDQLAGHDALSPAEKVALVSARWRAGDWQDVTHGTEGEVDLDRALAEVAAGSDLGKQLLNAGLRAIEMLREDLAAEGGN